MPLPRAGNDVIRSAHLVLRGILDENQAECMDIKSYYIITREILAHKSMYINLTRITIAYDIINANALKAPWKAKGQCYLLPLT